MKSNEIIEKLREMLDKAYIPYSNFPVSAIVETENQNYYYGCNIENGSYSATCCAERVAIFNAVSNGETKITKMHVMAKTKKPVSPCGVCRQVMSEFMSQKAKIVLYNYHGESKEFLVEQILPYSFDLEKDRE